MVPLLVILRKIIFSHFVSFSVNSFTFIVSMENQALPTFKTHGSRLRTALSNGMLCSVKEQHSVLCSRERLWDCLFLTN